MGVEISSTLGGWWLPGESYRQLILGGKPSSRSWHTIVCHGWLYFASQNSPRSHIIDNSEAITAPLPSTDNAKQSLTTRLLPSFQFSWKSLENSQRHIQSSSSPPPHLPKYTSIKHQHFGRDYGNAAIHRQNQMIPHHQAIANTPIIKKIT